MTNKNLTKVHWSFWVIAAIGLIFNLMGCLNFISQMNSDSVASMPDAYRIIVEIRPVWATAAFAIAVFGGVIGCLLLLLRKSIALYVFIAALIGTLVAQLPFIGMTNFPMEAVIGWLVQVVVIVFLTCYTKWTQTKRWIN